MGTSERGGVYRGDDRARDNETKISANVSFRILSLLFVYSSSG